MISAACEPIGIPPRGPATRTSTSRGTAMASRDQDRYRRIGQRVDGLGGQLAAVTWVVIDEVKSGDWAIGGMFFRRIRTTLTWANAECSRLQPTTALLRQDLDGHLGHENVLVVRSKGPAPI